MCKHKMIEMPIAYSGKEVSKDYILTHGIACMSVPFDMGTFRKLKERADGAKRTTYCVDVVFNPLIVNLFMDDEFCNAMNQYRPFVINLALNRIKESIGVQLTSQQVKLVKSLRYKDGEGNTGSVPKILTEIADDHTNLDEHETYEVKKNPIVANDAPLIEDLTPGPRCRKPAIKKGFLNSGKSNLYGPEGSGEGVLPENAGDPMGWMPKKLRQNSKIVDCNAPEWQENEKKRREAEESNKMNQEFRDTISKDMAAWSKRSELDKWAGDLPDGTEDASSCKYDVDYSRFDKIDDVEDPPVMQQERDWYCDSNGQCHQIRQSSSTSETSATEENQPTSLKKGFLDNIDKPLYPKGSTQGGSAPDEAQMLKDLGNLMGQGGKLPDDLLFKELGNLVNADGAVKPSYDEPSPKAGLSVKTTKANTPEYTMDPAPEGLQLVVSVPGLTSMEGVSLDVTENQASLAFPSAAGLQPLRVELPNAVVPTGARAKFSRKTQQITVKLPLAVESS